MITVMGYQRKQYMKLIYKLGGNFPDVYNYLQPSLGDGSLFDSCLSFSKSMKEIGLPQSATHFMNNEIEYYENSINVVWDIYYLNMFYMMLYDIVKNNHEFIYENIIKFDQL